MDGDGRPATSDPNATYRFALAWDTLATKDMSWAQELTVFDNVVVGQIDNTYNHPR